MTSKFGEYWLKNNLELISFKKMSNYVSPHSGSRYNFLCIYDKVS
jgi:hypothetical protein